MAARKKAGLPAKASNNLPITTSWADRMAAMAQRAVEREPVTGGSYIGVTGDGNFRYGDEVLGDTLSVVVVDFVFDNAYYDKPYDPDNPQPPACFAIADNEEDLVPHESVPSPEDSACANCWANEFGSDSRQRGKACKNQRRLAVLAVDPENDFVVAPDSEVAILRLSPSSLKFWKSYVTKLARVTGLPPAGVVTELSLEAIKGQSGYMVKPIMVQEITDPASQDAVILHMEHVADLLHTPYNLEREEREEKPKRGRAPAKRAPAKKPAPEKPAVQGRASRRKF
jgi:hypothetical protein